MCPLYLSDSLRLSLALTGILKRPSTVNEHLQHCHHHHRHHHLTLIANNPLLADHASQSSSYITWHHSLSPNFDIFILKLQVHGYYFNSKYWHHRRDMVLERLTFNPAIDRYIYKVYSSLLFMLDVDSDREGDGDHDDGGGVPPTLINTLMEHKKMTVSVHLRVGYSGEPAAGNLQERGFPPLQYFVEAFASIVGGKDTDTVGNGKTATTFLIFADDVAKAQAQLKPLASQGYSMVYIEENVVTSVRMMAMCKHHIMTSSTLSFWGAYLDPQQMQPGGGRTLLHESFFEQHGKGMIPDDYAATWEVLTTTT